MSAPTKQKLCWNCEASVSLAEENCPYCAVYLGPATITGYEEEEELAPPYKMEETQEVPASPFEAEKPVAKKEEYVEDEPLVHQSNGEMSVVAIPMSLLLGGTVFFLFGIILYLFSREGVFTLHWNGEYWYLYQLLALPMLYFGWKALQRVDEVEQDQEI